MSANQTSVFLCKRCGIEARHQWQEWDGTPFWLRLVGRTRQAEGWVCTKTKCGRKNRRIVTTTGAGRPI